MTVGVYVGVCVCSSTVLWVKHHNSISQDHITQTMSGICDQLIVLQLALNLLSLSLTFLGNYHMYSVVCFVNVLLRHCNI